MAEAAATEQSEASMHGLSALLLRVAHLKAAVNTGLMKTAEWADAHPPSTRLSATGEPEGDHEDAVQTVRNALLNIMACVYVIEMECPAVVAAAVSHDFAPGIAANGYRSLLRVLHCALTNVQVGERECVYGSGTNEERERKGEEKGVRQRYNESLFPLSLSLFFSVCFTLSWQWRLN